MLWGDAVGSGIPGELLHKAEARVGGRAPTTSPVGGTSRSSFAGDGFLTAGPLGGMCLLGSRW